MRLSKWQFTFLCKLFSLQITFHTFKHLPLLIFKTQNVEVFHHHWMYNLYRQLSGNAHARATVESSKAFDALWENGSFPTVIDRL